MISKFPAASKLALLLAAGAVVAASFAVTANAQSPRSYDDRGRPYYGSNGPNVSYQQGPHTRIYVTKRSWLDAGTEVLPGDRKFLDYAFPQCATRSASRTTIDRPNASRSIRRRISVVVRRDLPAVLIGDCVGGQGAFCAVPIVSASHLANNWCGSLRLARLTIMGRRPRRT